MKHFLNGIALTVLAAGLVLGVAAAPAHAAAPANIRCAVAKRKVAVKKLHAVDACFGKSTLTAQPADPACLAKANQKLEREFARLEASGDCQPETGDAGVAERVVDQCEATLARTLPGRCVASGAPCESAAPCCGGFCIGGEVGQTPVCR